MDRPLTPDRFRRIARAVERLVEGDEELVITATDEGVVVSEAPVQTLAEQHPRLYGRLLCLNVQMERSWLVSILAFILLGIFWLGLQTGWWEAWLSEAAAEAINVWWMFLLLMVLVFRIIGGITDYQARWVYRRSRADLWALMREAELDRDVLLVRIHGDTALTNVSRQLKLDRNPLP